jgi:hypothetical protein
MKKTWPVAACWQFREKGLVREKMSPKQARRARWRVEESFFMAHPRPIGLKWLPGELTNRRKRSTLYPQMESEMMDSDPLRTQRRIFFIGQVVKKLEFIGQNMPASPAKLRKGLL